MSNLNFTSFQIKKCCCFTGYRPDKFPFLIENGNSEYEKLKIKINDALISLIDDGYLTYYTGMAMGFDIIAAEAVLELKKQYNNLRLICALPFPEQGKGFPVEWRERFNNIINNADEVISINDKYYKGCYSRRNNFMVNKCDYVITWFDGQKGGTENTLKFASKNHRSIINLNEECCEYNSEQTFFNI